MDPFEVRMQFIEVLRRLNASVAILFLPVLSPIWLIYLKHSSQQSIQKVVSFAVKYFPPCGEDIWDCIIEETEKVCLILESRLTRGP